MSNQNGTNWDESDYQVPRGGLHCVAGDIWLTVRYYFMHNLLKYRETFSSFAMKAGKGGRKEARVEHVSSM